MEVETASMDDLKKMIRDAQEKIAERDQDIQDLEDDKVQISADFNAQLNRVKEEFAEMSKIAVKEQEDLQNRIAELETELEHANASGNASNAQVILENKKKIDDLTAKYEEKLKKSSDRTEKLQEQLDKIKGKG